MRDGIWCASPTRTSCPPPASAARRGCKHLASKQGAATSLLRPAAPFGLLFILGLELMPEHVFGDSAAELVALLDRMVVVHAAIDARVVHLRDDILEIIE